MADSLVGAAAIAATVTLSPLLAWRYRRWGATLRELREPLPGDELVPEPRLESTRAIDIAAPPEQVWPWLAQLGHGKAGLYSYELLENLLGCDIHNADAVVPAWQELAPGDAVRLGPEGYPCFRVREVQAPSRLVLLAGEEGGAMKNSWVFLLRPQLGGTRFLVRSRYDFPRTAGQRFLWRALTEPMHFVMERRMLLGVRERAEGAASAPAS